MSRIRARVVVHGRVQGVWFRGTAADHADHERVSGWAHNRSDGTVEAVFEGEPDAVDRMVSFCESGPAGARVERVERFDEPPEGLQGFETD